MIFLSAKIPQDASNASFLRSIAVKIRIAARVKRKLWHNRTRFEMQ
jgi:hypothetical protein